jgi:hypothetical protein
MFDRPPGSAGAAAADREQSVAGGQGNLLSNPEKPVGNRAERDVM